MATGKTFKESADKTSNENLITQELQFSNLKPVLKNVKLHATGHRKRVREKFEKQDSSKFLSIEIIEALLFFCNSRKDVKEEAFILNKMCDGNMLKFLFLDDTKLKAAGVSNVLNNFVFLQTILKEIISRYYKDKIVEYTFKSIKEIADYLMSRAALLTHEELRVIYLNSKSKLIDDAVVSTGTINETAIYIREVVAGCLKKAAVSIIISHNHPSGEVAPSRDDIDITYKLKQALETVSVALDDHIIVSQNKYFSFKLEGLL